MSNAEPRLTRLFGLDEDWQRPSPPLARQDAILACAFMLFAALGLELVRSFGEWASWAKPYWAEYLALVTGTLPLALRRRFPLSIAAYEIAHWVVAGSLVPELAYQLAMEVAYFFALYSGVAWARRRRVMLALVAGVILVVFAWMAWDVAFGSALADFTSPPDKRDPRALFQPIPALVAWTWTVTTVYLAAAVGLGQLNWRQARDQARVEAQNATIAAQSAALRDRAVVDERLRIARELHDVVAHHISVIGIQAGAARRVLTRDPDAAASALEHVEDAAREAVVQMRGLLGTLRGGEPDDHSRRAPEPTASDIESLASSFTNPHFDVRFAVVEDRPGAIDAIPAPVGLSLYRTAAEALTNVRRHSTASRAGVTLRVGRDAAGPRYAEVEILDAGRPRTGTSGTGLGQLGMRERIATHSGTAEIGPRLTGGYRVRVRLPLKEES